MNDPQALIPLIYEAAAASEAWPEALARIAELFAGSACALAVYNFRARSGLFYKTIGYDPDHLRAYLDRYAAQNVWLRSENPYRQPDAVITGRQLVPHDELVRSEFYQEWLAPQDLFHRLCTVLLREEAGLCYLAVMRPRTAPAFTEEDVARARLLLPHLRQAVRLHRKLATLQRKCDATLEALNRLPLGVVIVDERCATLAVNRSAEEILQAAEGLAVQAGTVRAATHRETEALRRLIKGAVLAADGVGTESGGALTLPRPSGARPLEVLVAPLRADSELLGERRAAAALFVRDPEALTDVPEERLRRLYRLSRGEARLAAALAQGNSLEEAARALGLSTNNARAYLKRIFDKTGVNRQVELIRLLLVGPAQLRGN
jgi:DNA-binding CsgD family transcriptional regulator